MELQQGVPVGAQTRRNFLQRAALSAPASFLGVGRTRAQSFRSKPTSDEVATTGISIAGLSSFDHLMTSFLKEQEVPGAALAVTRRGRLVYARGFGHADQQRKEPVQPTSLFRIASVSKPFTAVAVLQLAEKNRFNLSDKVFDILKLHPHLEPGARVDQRLKEITVLEVLPHTAGWDRAKSFDPMFRPLVIARALKVPPPAKPADIIRYMMGKPLDFDPGRRYAYSNFGYACWAN
jgi:N-acyl-D-amino-acid deacylase